MHAPVLQLVFQNPVFTSIIRKLLKLTCFICLLVTLRVGILEMQAKPRPALPPPIGPIATFRFDEANLAFPAIPIAITNAQTVESFSGMALVMAGSGPALLALPQIILSNKNILPEQAGTIELWFSPLWDSGQAGGTGSPQCLSNLFGGWRN